MGGLPVVPMTGEPTPSVFLQTPFRETYAAFSPDGRWVAYHSNESGRPEVYVRPFVEPGVADNAAVGRWQFSTAGEMMAAPVTFAGGALEPGAPVVLFPTRIYGGGVDVEGGRQYDFAPDGRFLINTELDDADTAAPITLIQNWHPEATTQ